MESSPVMFVEEFRSSSPMFGSEQYEELSEMAKSSEIEQKRFEKMMEMRLEFTSTRQFALQLKQLDGRTEIGYRIVSQSDLSMAFSFGLMHMPIPSMPEIVTGPVEKELPAEAHVVEVPNDFQNQMNVRFRLLLTRLGKQFAANSVGLVPPLWFVELPELQRWLTAGDFCKVAVDDTVEFAIEDPHPHVEQVDVGLALELRIVSATRIAPQNGGGYEVEWRIDAMKAHRVFNDTLQGIERTDCTGRSQGIARFDDSSLLISLTGTGTSQEDMVVNSDFKGFDGKSTFTGTMPGREDRHNISVRRL